MQNGHPEKDPRELTRKVIDTYEKYSLESHEEVSLRSEPVRIARKVEAFGLYKDYLKGGKRILEWGCGDGMIGYVIREYLSDDTVEIHGCDLIRDNRPYEFFSQQANLVYSNLNHPYRLPYEDEYFDIAVGNGVLEHTANDYEAIKELYRILRNEGYLIITFLPNILSYTEFLNRTFRGRGHMRLYSKGQIKRMLMHSGFLPVVCRHHQVLPSLSSLKNPRLLRFATPITSKLFQLNKYAERIWPITMFASNIFVAAQRMPSFPVWGGVILHKGKPWPLRRQ